MGNTHKQERETTIERVKGGINSLSVTTDSGSYQSLTRAESEEVGGMYVEDNDDMTDEMKKKTKTNFKMVCIGAVAGKQNK